MLATLPFFEPVKFDIGSIPIHGFGIMVALGLYIGTEMAMRKASRDGLDPDIINRVVTWMIVGIFVGGHLGHAFFYEPYKLFGGIHNGVTYPADPMYLIRVWDGLSSFGGFIVTAFLCWLFFRKENNRVKKANPQRKRDGKNLLFPIRATHYGDAVIYGFPMAFGFGRIGCFMAHDHPGLESEFFLAVKGVCRNHWGNSDYACHDLGLYEAIWACSMIFVVMFLDRKARFPGFYLAVIPMVYAPFRLFFDSLRTADVRYTGLTPAQYGAICLFLIGASVFMVQRKKRPARELTAESDAIPFDVNDLASPLSIVVPKKEDEKEESG